MRSRLRPRRGGIWISTLGTADPAFRCLLVYIGQVRGAFGAPGACGCVDSTVTKGRSCFVTKVPWPCLVSTRPRLVSRLIASLMVFREAEYASLSPSSVGS